MTLKRFALLAATTTAFSTSAFAQLPDVEGAHEDAAQSIAEGAMAKASSRRLQGDGVVVHSLNMPKTMLRMTATGATTEAAMKATATMLYNRPSWPGDNALLLWHGGATRDDSGTHQCQGAVPIKVGDDYRRGRRQRRAPGGQRNAACAAAGIAKAADKLK